MSSRRAVRSGSAPVPVPVPLAETSVARAVLDRVLALLLLVLASPLVLGVAVAIKVTSPGPVLFRQRRNGRGNTVFEIYKFRTMADDPAHDPADDPAHDPAMTQARRDDPRVTRLGAFLRRHYIDEIPQLLNVLAGSMSLVGPRPHAVQHNRYYSVLIDGYDARHAVRPGITGWAQVNGLHGETADPEMMARRVEYDLHYIRHRSLMLDLRILLRSALVWRIPQRAP